MSDRPTVDGTGGRWPCVLCGGIAHEFAPSSAYVRYLSLLFAFQVAL
jgi:hypothetical protein